MEAIFIQKIYHMTEQLLRGDLSPKKAITELELHLTKAQSMKLPIYEAEVLNTLAITAYLQHDYPQAQAQWGKMLVISDALNNEKLITKACSNMAELLVEQYQYQEAIDYLEKGLSKIQQGGQSKLSALNLYSMETTTYIALGNFDKAQESAKIFWQAVNNADLENYSRYEYGQIIAVMHNCAASLALIAKDSEAFQKHSQLAADLARTINHAFYPESAQFLHQLLYAILIENDPAKALEWENKLKGLENTGIPLNELKKLLEILYYSGHGTAAKKYAQQIIMMPDATPKLKHFAEKVLAETPA